MRRLRDQGVAILFVSHFLDQVYAISDRITVLRNGRFVGEYLTRELDRSQLISPMIGKDFETLHRSARNRRRMSRDARHATPVYAPRGSRPQGSDRTHRHRVVPGEIVGFAGLLGAGRTELARLLSGADRADTGRITRRRARRELHSPSPASPPDRVLDREPPRRGHHRRPHRAREHHPRRAGPARLGPAPAAREQDEIVDKYIVELNVRPSDPERPDQEPVRRQPAEGAARALAGHEARAAHPRRADPRHRHRREGRDPGGHRGTRRRRHVCGLHLVGTRRGRSTQRENRGAERPPQDRRDHQRARHHRRHDRRLDRIDGAEAQGVEAFESETDAEAVGYVTEGSAK